MSNPRIIRALELIHEAKSKADYLATLVSGPNVTGVVASLNLAENELLTHLAESKRAEKVEVGR